MAKNYSKKCWCCGKISMVNRGDCFQCSECGATWNKVTSSGQPALIIENDPRWPGCSLSKGTKGKPGPSAIVRHPKKAQA